MAMSYLSSPSTSTGSRFLPTDSFGLLHHYKIELQHLNPNRIQHITAFVVLCEGYLGIKPHFELWKYFFTVSLQKKREKNKAELSVPMGCASIHLRAGWAGGYIPIALMKTNKGWHKLWFYLMNDAAAPTDLFRSLD
jgi:hypothetical protein